MTSIKLIIASGQRQIGIFAKGVKTCALKKACEKKAETDTEAWMSYFEETFSLFKVGKIKAQSWVVDSDVRLTVDTPKDFELMKVIFEAFYLPGKVFSLAEVLLYLKEHPEVTEINKGTIQLPQEHFPFGLRPEYEKYHKV